jgi:RHS repeat-associated protein
MLSDGLKLYEYNEANQLKRVKSATNSATIAEYLYDFNGNRMVKKNYVNGSLANTVYSWSDSFETKVIEGGATETTVYYFANKELVGKKDNSGNRTYIHNDHLGSTSIVTNSGGSLVESTSYDPWGEVLAGGTQSKFGYTGQEHDSETGLDYYNFRYYNSDIRRFAQPDDIIQDWYNPQDLNRYSYVRNNPLRYTDPTGHAVDDEVSPVIPYIGSIGQDYDRGRYLEAAWNAADFSPIGFEKVAVVGFINKIPGSEKVFSSTSKQIIQQSEKILNSPAAQKTANIGKTMFSKSTQVVQQKLIEAKHTITNGNNIIRIGKSSPSSPPRIAIGPAPKHYDQLSTIQKVLSPIHIHVEKNKIGIDLNWLKKSFYKKW